MRYDVCKSTGENIGEKGVRRYRTMLNLEGEHDITTTIYEVKIKDNILYSVLLLPPLGLSRFFKGWARKSFADP